MKKWISLLIFVISVFLIIGQGCNSEESQTSKNKGFESFSFAVITDIHVGRNFSDYGAQGWADYDLTTGQAINNNEGDFNYVTDRLVATVNWLNENHEKGNIKFLVILGDVADSAEMSEFFRAKKILNNLQIPYIPLVGNHDVWSNVKDPNCWDIQSTDGELYFERIFWRDIHNKNNIDRINSLFGNSWQRQRALTDSFHLLQNYAFSYQGITFVALDYARRDSNCTASVAEPFPETKEWLKDNLENHRGEVVLVFSHYPYADWHALWGGFEPWEADYLADLASENNVSVLNFGGHIHYDLNVNEVFEQNSKAPVIVTKGLMGGRYDLSADFLRIVRVNGPQIGDIDYNNEPLKSIDSAGIVTILPNVPTSTPTSTPTVSLTETPTSGITPTQKPTTPTIVPENTQTPAPTLITPTKTPTVVPKILTSTPTIDFKPTLIPTPTPTIKLTMTSTTTSTPTPTLSPTLTLTPTPTPTTSPGTSFGRCSEQVRQNLIQWLEKNGCGIPNIDRAFCSFWISNFDYTLNDCDLIGDKIWVTGRYWAGGYGTIFYSPDSSQNWELQWNSDVWGPDPFAVDFLTENEGWVATDDNILHTINSGKNWNEIFGVKGIFVWLREFQVIDNMHLQGRLSDGTLIKTEDGGKTWLYSKDGGQTWQPIQP